MILVFASIFNKAAAAFVSSYRGAAVSLVTCSSVSLQSSCFAYPNFDDSYITLKNKKVFIKDINGVINLLPAIIPDEMYFYDETEYAYQAQEFTALFVFLMEALKVPVINKPSPHNLSGKVLNNYGWHHLAAILKIPQVITSFKSNNVTPPAGKQKDVASIIYCNKLMWPANANPIAKDYTIRIAEYTGATYVKASFTTEGLLFVTATTMPDVSLPEVCRLLRRALKRNYVDENIFMGVATRSSNAICI